MASQRSTVLHQIGCLVKNPWHSASSQKDQAKFFRALFQKETDKNCHQSFGLPRVCVPSDLLGFAARLSGRWVISAPLCESKPHLQENWMNTWLCSLWGQSIYSVNFWTYSINVLPKQAPELCFPAYLRVSVKQLNHVIHHLRHDILLASSDCPWQVGSSYKSFGASKLSIDSFYFAYFILGVSSPEVGVSKFLRNTAPRNNKVLAQTLVESKRRVVQLWLKSDCLEKVSKYLWIQHPHYQCYASCWILWETHIHISF